MEHMQLIPQEDGSYIAYLDHFSTYALIESNKTFTDIIDHWAKAHIEIMAAKGITDGTGPDHYSPNDALTRGQFAAFLNRAFYLDMPSNASMGFADVKEGTYYYDSILTLYSLGIIEGHSPSEFKPDTAISREEAFTMLMKTYAFMTGWNTDDMSTSDPLLDDFTDVALLEDWAAKYVAKGVELGLIEGKGHNNLDPDSSITRGEISKLVIMLLRHLKHIK
jgi:hypothetical protein